VCECVTMAGKTNTYPYDIDNRVTIEVKWGKNDVILCILLGIGLFFKKMNFSLVNMKKDRY
jgi:hypothetical protein